MSFLEIADDTQPQPTGNATYELEKILGTRRASGSLNLKRLRAKHLRVIELHCLGHRNVDVANQLGLSQTYVSVLLTDPLVEQEITLRQREAKQEFDALRFQANNVVRDALEQHRPMGQRLRAADMFYKAQGDYVPDRAHNSDETAEDVIQRMLTLNLQVNVDGKQLSVSSNDNS